MKYKNTNYLKFTLIYFLSFFLAFNIILKLFGYPARYDFVRPVPYTWSEIYYALPHTFFLTSLITGFCLYLYIGGEKAKEKRLKEIHKRRTEKEKNEKEMIEGQNKTE